MIQDLELTNFTAGELSPRLTNRYDEAKYFNGCRTLRNFVVLPQGGAMARPGTMFVAQPPDQTNGERLIPFTFSTAQAYVLGFGNLYASVYANDGVVTANANPVQIAMPYLASEVPAIGYVQSFDTMWLLHNAHPPQELTRTGATTFNLTTAVFRDGPYEAMNATPTTFSPSAPTGAITITASSVTGINAGSGFQSTDVGRFVRMQMVGIWAWAIITAVLSTTQVSATIQPLVQGGAWGMLDGATWQQNTRYITGYVCAGTAGNTYKCLVGGISSPTGAGPSGTSGSTVIYDGSCQWVATGPVPSTTVNWQLSKWNSLHGWPSIGMFWQNRLVLMNTPEQPNIIELSVTGDFTNFAPTGPDGTVTDSNACSWQITDDQVNAIRWATPAGSAQAMQLGIGTTGGEDILQAATTSAALTPTNVQAYRETSYGSAPNVRAVRVGKSVLFANRTGRKLHEWTFSWQVNGYSGPDLTVLAEHITRATPVAPDTLGIVALAYQQNPHSVLWAIRSDGQLIGLTYLKDQDIVGWHQHQLGGQYFGGPPRVESLCVIPSPQGGYDELWLEVLRTIGGVPTRFIEVLTPYFDGQRADFAWQVDCGLRTVLTMPGASVTPGGLTASTDPDRPVSYSGSGTLTANTAVFTGTAGAIVRLAGGKAIITGVTSGLSATIQVLDPLTNQGPNAAGTWSLAAKSPTASGLAYLAGETVVALGDGQVTPAQTVSPAGTITLAAPAALVTAGLPYTPALLTMPFEPTRAAQASANGRVKRISTLYMRFHESAGGTFGTRQVDPLTDHHTVKTQRIVAREATYPMGQAAPLFSGVRRMPAVTGYDREQMMMVLQTDPLPLTILGISASADVEEMTAQ